MRAVWAAGVGLLLAAGCGGVPNGDPASKLFVRACSRCHPAETALGVRRDLEGWRRTIWGMRQKGARIDDQEAEEIARYLARVRGIR
ncbi:MULTISPECIES: hypothetical protein [Deferrisoma]